MLLPLFALSTSGAAAGPGADVAVGDQVVVAQGVAIQEQWGRWHGMPGEPAMVPNVAPPGWPAEVVAIEGLTVKVRLATDGCVEPLQAARAFDVTATVREAELVPLLTRDVSGEDGGDTWFVGAGTPVVGGRASLGSGITVAVDGAPTARSVPRIRRARDVSGAVRRVESGTFRGELLTPARPIVVSPGPDRATWAGRCATLTFQPGPLLPRASLTGPNVLPETTRWLPAGLSLYWPGGGFAGVLRAPIAPPAGPFPEVPFPAANDGRSADAFALRLDPLDLRYLAATGKVAPPGLLHGLLLGEPRVVGEGLTAEQIAAVVDRDLPGITRCRGAPATRISLSFGIARDGTVAKRAVYPEDPAELCLVRRAEAMRFPPPTSGAEVRVHYERMLLR